MDLLLKRTYYEDGTNSDLFINEQQIGYTIELPWKNNQKRFSCIPEGKYHLVKRISPKFGNTILVTDVKGRDLILIHPANDAKKELLGCIAPVTKLTGPGRGVKSRMVYKDVLSAVYGAIDKNEDVFLTITKK